MKMQRHKRFFLSILFFGIGVFSAVFALTVPHLQGPVNDIAGVLSPSEKESIESFLLNTEQSSQLQIAVLIVKSLEGESLEDYSMSVVESWKLGSKEKDSGALLFISIDDRKIRIETGYGLEAHLTDAACAKIIRTVIAPAFRNRDYGSGILEGVKAMAGYALKDESLIKNAEKAAPERDMSLQLFVIILIVIYVLFSRLSGRGLWWLPLLWLASDSSDAHINTPRSRRYSGFSGRSSGSGFGGFSGGGYSGGGGSFGGGGASGGW